MQGAWGVEEVERVAREFGEEVEGAAYLNGDLSVMGRKPS